MDTLKLNESWLAGTYRYGVINTSLPFVEISGEYTSDGEPVFIQGEDAENYIAEIHQLWLTYDLTTEEAFLKWIILNW